MHSVPSLRGVLCHAHYLLTRLGTPRRATLAASYGRVTASLGLDRTTHLLNPSEREALALAFYLDDQIAAIGVDNYAAPALLLASLLEQAVRRRVIAPARLTGFYASEGRQTLGALPTIRYGASKPVQAVEGVARREQRENWRQLTAWAALNWDETIIPFEHYVCSLERTAKLRNDAAHNPFPVEDYNRLYTRICGEGGQHGQLAQLVTACRGETC